jgi:hypothetical protein
MPEPVQWQVLARPPRADHRQDRGHAGGRGRAGQSLRHLDSVDPVHRPKPGRGIRPVAPRPAGQNRSPSPPSPPCSSPYWLRSWPPRPRSLPVRRRRLWPRSGPTHLLPPAADRLRAGRWRRSTPDRRARPGRTRWARAGSAAPPAVRLTCVTAGNRQPAGASVGRLATFRTG